jgi:hypothetical protein
MSSITILEHLPSITIRTVLVFRYSKDAVVLDLAQGVPAA